MSTRREFLAVAGATALLGAFSKEALAQALPPKSPMGIAGAAMGGYNGGVPAAVRSDQIAYVNYCRSLGAGGVQISPSGDAATLRRLRARLEQLEMFVEGNARMPASLDEDTAAFEKTVTDAKAVGATVLRAVSRPPQGTSGRRYEGFKSHADYTAWLTEANAIVLKVLPIVEKHGMILASENHKDRTADEIVAFVSKVSSPALGVLVDPGNNMSFMEDPVETCTKLAPYVRAVSMKDMGVAPYEDGFLLSEVIFGTGATDQAALWKIMKAAYAPLNMVEELITRDPLKVPVYTSAYYASFPEKTAVDTAKWMEWVKAKQTELPYVDGLTPQQRMEVEADNHRKSLEWARLNMV
jgi:sugar phosphate isomerase/epimerase